MPFVTPIPVGGFGRELANLNERMRAIEQSRAAAEIISQAYGATTISSTSFNAPTGWTGQVQFTLATSAGFVILYGAAVEPKVPVDGSDIVELRVKVNGTVISTTSGSAGSIGQPLQSADGDMAVMVQMPDGTVYNKPMMPFGSYTLAIEAACGDSGQSYTLRSGYLTAWIL